MNNLLKVEIPAAAMTGGRHAHFQGCEYVSGVALYSAPRRCIRLECNRTVSGTFVWPGLRRSSYRCIFRIRGMWDMYKHIALSFMSSVDMKTRGVFEVRLNGHLIFNGPVQFMNYRHWRFWYPVELPIPAGWLTPGRNNFTVTNRTAPFKPLPTAGCAIPEELLNNTAYQISDIQILALAQRTVAPVRLPAGTYFGHLIGGHEGTLPAGDDLSLLLDLFIQEDQGNLVGFLFNSHFYEIDPATINTDLIRRAGLSVAIRNHFNYAGPSSHDLAEGEYNRRLRLFLRRLGRNFLGFAPHEQHGVMHQVIAESNTPDLAVVTQKFEQRFRAIVQKCRAIQPGARVWETDPSFYHRHYLKGGAAFPAIEVCGNHVSLTSASARGTAKASGLDRWGAINSWDCQGFGGLSARPQHVRFDPDFDRKRRNLCWLSQFLLYLGGARMIYSESGAFYQRLTAEKEFEHPHLRELRAIQRELIAFAQRHRLQGQPISAIGYLQGQYDVTSVALNPAFFKTTGYAPYTWKNLEVCYPNFDLDCHNENATNFWRRYDIRQDMFSDTPYGEADILPIEAPPAAMRPFRFLMLTGWNTMDARQFVRLKAYVRQGGVLSLVLPQLTRSCRTDTPPCDHIPSRWLRELGGVQWGDTGALATAPLNHLTGTVQAMAQYPSAAQLMRRQSGEIFYLRCGSAYNAYLRNLRLVSRSARALFTESASGFPFLVEHRIGKGLVYLFNVADYPKFPTVYYLFQAVLRDLADRCPQDIRLVSGRQINFFVYPSPRSSVTRCRIFVVANNWFSRKTAVPAAFSIYGKTVRLTVRQNRVTLITVLRNGRRIIQGNV